MSLYQNTSKAFILNDDESNEDSSEDFFIENNNKRKKLNEKNVTCSEKLSLNKSAIVDLDRGSDIDPEESALIVNEVSTDKKSNNTEILSSDNFNSFKEDDQVRLAREILKNVSSVKRKLENLNEIQSVQKVEPYLLSSEIILPQVKSASERIKSISNENNIKYPLIIDDCEVLILDNLKQTANTNEGKINIKTRLNGSHNWVWKIPKNQYFSKFKTKFVELYGLPIGADKVIFKFDGDVLEDTMTPDSADLDDDFIVDVEIPKIIFQQLQLPDASGARPAVPPAAPPPVPLVLITVRPSPAALSPGQHCSDRIYALPASSLTAANTIDWLHNQYVAKDLRLKHPACYSMQPQAPPLPMDSAIAPLLLAATGTGPPSLSLFLRPAAIVVYLDLAAIPATPLAQGQPAVRVVPLRLHPDQCVGVVRAFLSEKILCTIPVHANLMMKFKRKILRPEHDHCTLDEAGLKDKDTIKVSV